MQKTRNFFGTMLIILLCLIAIDAYFLDGRISAAVAGSSQDSYVIEANDSEQQQVDTPVPFNTPVPTEVVLIEPTSEEAVTELAQIQPSNTAVPPPTNTAVPLPTDTPVPPPTSTAVPPTDTSVPLPTDTPVPPPTETPVLADGSVNGRLWHRCGQNIFNGCTTLKNTGVTVFQNGTQWVCDQPSTDEGYFACHGIQPNSNFILGIWYDGDVYSDPYSLVVEYNAGHYSTQPLDLGDLAVIDGRLIPPPENN